MSNTNVRLSELVRTQANSLLGNITAELDNSYDYSADTDILNKVLEDKKVTDDLGRIEDYIKYYNCEDTANFHEITMVLRLGMRIGAYYMIEDSKRNEYVYFDDKQGSDEDVR